MNNKNILVTGGLGILGSALVKKLNQKKIYNIFILDRSKNIKKIKVLELGNLKKVKIIKGNFNDYKTVFKVIKNKNISTIFHLGAITQVIDAYKSPMETFNSNIIGTINILESIRNLKKKNKSDIQFIRQSIWLSRWKFLSRKSSTKRKFSL